MAKRRRRYVPRRVYRYIPRRRSGGGRRLGGWGSLLVGALTTIAGTWLASKFLPANWALAGGAGIAGGLAYLFDGKTAGKALLGSAVGLAAYPYVVGALGGGSTTTEGGQVWV